MLHLAGSSIMQRTLHFSYSYTSYRHQSKWSASYGDV